ncbi:MAG: nicotinate-nucleotide adenylyltransferase [Bacteroidota bacterium]|nr:nicotinate-nucleotide adenylyltransferase [Bacteroidota bacterium]
MNVGLFFGSFNPIHVGHLLAATYIREAAGLDNVWFIVSPQNPFKKTEDLIDETHRLEMTKLAVQNTPYLKVSDVEFSLSKPSYTHQTLKELERLHKKANFHIIIGEDLVVEFDSWKEATWIRENFKVIVYNRSVDGPQSTVHSKKNSNFKLFRLPLFDISSTEIRKRIKNKQPIRFFVTPHVEQYIAFHKLYL